MSCGNRTERGSATVYIASALVGLTALAVAVSGFTALAATKHRAAAAADLAALAGAKALQEGVDPCASAADLAARNGAALDECTVDGRVVTVLARAQGPDLLGRSWTFESAARAGPTGLSRRPQTGER